MSYNPIVFAHRGGMAHHPQNTTPAFERAVAHGATGIETDAFLTKDGHVVLAHNSNFKTGFRRKQLIRDTLRADLPAFIPSLDDLLDRVTPEHHIFIDVKDIAALRFMSEILLQRRDPSDLRLWLAHAGFNESQWELVDTWSSALPGVQLVDSTTVARMGGDQTRYLKRIGESTITCLNLPIAEWKPYLVNLCHGNGLTTMAFRVHDKRKAKKAFKLGLDAMHGDDVDAMIEVVRTANAVDA